MINVTPEKYRCSVGGCPRVDYTPPAMRCPSGDYPSVEGENGLLTIVGKQVTSDKAGPGEAAIEIEEGLLADIPAVVALRAQIAELEDSLEEALFQAKAWRPTSDV